MPDDRDETLAAIRDDVRSMRTDVEVVRTKTENIDEKTDRLESRVFGPEGLDSQVQTNSEQISRLNGFATLVAGATTTVLAKILNFL